jgi:hypothetical protein
MVLVYYNFVYLASILNWSLTRAAEVDSASGPFPSAYRHKKRRTEKQLVLVWPFLLILSGMGWAAAFAFSESGNFPECQYIMRKCTISSEGF